VEDPFGNDVTGTITVIVTSPQAPPTSLWTPTNTPVTVDVSELAFDPDGDSLSESSVTQGSHGTVSVSGNVVTYTPNTGYTGNDSFDYTVEDGDGNEATNTIIVSVGPTDPVAVDDEVTTSVDTAVNVTVLDRASQPAAGGFPPGRHGRVHRDSDSSEQDLHPNQQLLRRPELYGFSVGAHGQKPSGPDTASRSQHPRLHSPTMR
jgi:hypothetical protein